jgi:GNAT superfamily N-acetyltransferase
MRYRPANGKVRVTYLQMLERPAGGAAHPPDGVSLEPVPARALDLAEYRSLYRRVGDPWLWVARRRMDDGELRAVFDHPRYELFYARAAGAPIGFAELDRREAGSVEIRYFGLIDEWIGRGAGRWFLRAMLDLAWSDPAVTRVWLHTCELDHPGALGFYQRGGLVIYGEGVEDYVDPDAVSRW